ncbi:MAG: universal stress protein [Caldilineaceae bacterium]|nr:universal stress protein [Caldilineaceae bacterium]
MTQRKLLIPLDGSDFSHQIVRVVRSFFDPSDVRIVLLRVANPPAAAGRMHHEVYSVAPSGLGSYESYSQILETEYASVESDLEVLRTEVQESMRAEVEQLRAAGYTVRADVRFGDPAERIVDYAKRESVELIAMATHGRTGLGRLVLGSVAERILRSVSTPVLLMRPDVEVETGQSPAEQLTHSLGGGNKLRLAVATDGSTLAQQAVSRASELAQQLGADFVLLVVSGDQDDVAHGQALMQAASKLVQEISPAPEIVPLVGFADEVLLHYLAKAPVDLLAIGPFHDRGAGSSTAIGPTAQRLVQYAPTSVLMVKGRRPHTRRILACVAVDDKTVVDVAAQMARATGATLRLLHVIPQSAATYLASPDTDEIPLQEALAQGTHLSSLLRDWITQLENQGLNQEQISIRRGSAAESILMSAHDDDIDLIVVGSQSGAGHFLGSVANSVVRYAEQSVMVVRTRLN